MSNPAAGAQQDISSSLSKAGRASNLRIRREFNDLDRDRFLDESFEAIASFFDSSLSELKDSNPHIEVRFRKLSADRFTAAIYSGGAISNSCTIWLRSPGGYSSRRELAFVFGETQENGTTNEMMFVEDDGYSIFFKPLGMNIFRQGNEEHLNAIGAAEYFWDMLVERLR